MALVFRIIFIMTKQPSPVIKEPLLQLAECISSGKLVSIFQVPTGSKCNCVLPSTDLPLIAKNKGKSPLQKLDKGQKQAHFAFAKGANPSYAIESAIHKLAKQVFFQNRTIRVPKLDPTWEFDLNIEDTLKKCFPVELSENDRDYYLQEGINQANRLLEKEFSSVQHTFGGVQLEVPFHSSNGKIIADAVGFIKGETKLLVEFKFTHKVDEKKKIILEDLNRSCIEVDVSNFVQLDEDGNINRKGMLEGLTSEDGFPMEWVHNAKRQKKETVIIERVKKEIRNRAYNKMKSERLKRNPKFLADRQDRGLEKLKVYNFKDNSNNIYCPKQDGNPISLSICRGCEFWGQEYFNPKTSKERAEQPPWLAKFPETMHILCGFKSQTGRTEVISMVKSIDKY